MEGNKLVFLAIKKKKKKPEKIKEAKGSVTTPPALPPIYPVLPGQFQVPALSWCNRVLHHSEEMLWVINYMVSLVLMDKRRCLC